MKKNNILILSIGLTFFYAHAMDNQQEKKLAIIKPAYLTYPEEYELFKHKQAYGRLKSNFDCLPVDVFNTFIRSPLAKALSIKFNHALLNHTYQQKKYLKDLAKHKEYIDKGFVSVAPEALDLDPLIEKTFQLTDVPLEKRKIFEYYDSTYTQVPDVGYNYAMWDETIEQKKISELTISEKKKQKLLLSGCNQRYGTFCVYFPNEEFSDNKYEFNIISKCLPGEIQKFTSSAQITHCCMNKHCTYLAVGSKNENRLILINLETEEIKAFPIENPLEILVAGHQSPIFLAGNKNKNGSQLISPLSNTAITLNHRLFNMPINAAISPDDQKYIIYADKKLILYVNQSTSIDRIHLKSWKVDLPNPIARASFIPDSTKLILALEDGGLFILDLLSKNLIQGYEMKWAIDPLHHTPPLLLYSVKNQLLLSLDPVAHQYSGVCTFVIRNIKNCKTLTAYNFYPTSPCAMGLTHDERSIIFINQDQTVSKLDLYSAQDINTINFIEKKAHFYDLCMLLDICKKYKPIAYDHNPAVNVNATQLVMALRDYIKQHCH